MARFVTSLRLVHHFFAQAGGQLEKLIRIPYKARRVRVEETGI